MRQTNDDIKIFINQRIQQSPESWKFNSGSNFGVLLQRLISKYYNENSKKFNIKKVYCNENPNSIDPDIIIHYNDNKTEKIEVKSCKNGALSGVTICNSPKLLSNIKTILINYSLNPKTNIIYAKDVYITQLHRLTSIVKSGKYSGCLISTRDTGKKIKGRSFKSFVDSSDKDDYSIEDLTNNQIIRKTVLYYSASKLVDKEYNFSDEEIIEAIHSLKKN